MDYSIIIPIYNEQDNIQLLHDRLHAVMIQLSSSFEFIFVNDGSRDNSMNLMRQLAEDNSYVKYIDLSRNFGHQIAVTSGLDLSIGDRVVIIDADLQDPPELILEMAEKMDKGNEVVYAKRRKRKGESWFKLITASVFYKILRSITSIDIPLNTGDFRMVDRQIVDVLKDMPEQNKFLRGQISWIGFRQTYVEYDRDERHAGETGYPLSKMLRFALDGITAFSDAPLKFVFNMGILVFFLSFLMIIYTLYSWLFLDNTVQGWSSTMVSILFIGGIQMIGIGIIGEYLSRVSNNVKNRPLYIINDTNIEK
ncbi:glycosyltransferase family 2 protein [Saprospiraceae bacterium]|nr:glycosyltransferase family 2 protein [Saprospiraceae bacterium]